MPVLTISKQTLKKHCAGLCIMCLKKSQALELALAIKHATPLKITLKINSAITHIFRYKTAI